VVLKLEEGREKLLLGNPCLTSRGICRSASEGLQGVENGSSDAVNTLATTNQHSTKLDLAALVVTIYQL